LRSERLRVAAKHFKSCHGIYLHMRRLHPSPASHTLTLMNTSRLLLVSLFALLLSSCVFAGAPSTTEPTPAQVLAGMRDFFAKTALPDGSYRPGIDPDYEGMADTAYSDLAAATYAVVLHRTFGWKLPGEEKTRAFFLSRQGTDGAFFNVKGTVDP